METEAGMDESEQTMNSSIKLEDAIAVASTTGGAESGSSVPSKGGTGQASALVLGAGSSSDDLVKAREMERAASSIVGNILEDKSSKEVAPSLLEPVAMGIPIPGGPQSLQPHSQPGAFQQSSGPNMQLAMPPLERSRLMPSEPGAFDSTDGTANEGANTNTTTATGVIDQNSSAHLSETMSVATLLEEEDLEIAEPMDPFATTSGPLQRNRKMRHRHLGIILGGGLLLLGVVVGISVFFATRSSSNNVPQRQSNNTATTAKGPEPLWALLPNTTQATILQDATNSTPQFRAYQWMQGDPNFHNYSDTRLLQRFALATFHFSTGGPSNWAQIGGETLLMVRRRPSSPQSFMMEPLGEGSRPIVSLQGRPPSGSEPPQWFCPQKSCNVTFSQWLTYDAHECNWYSSAPMCSNETVQALHMTANGLIGRLPEQLGLLSNLQRLILEAGRGGRIGGTLPSQIGKLRQLQQMRVTKHRFTGKIPSEIGNLKSLGGLTLGGTQFTGSIPAQVWTLSNLFVLGLVRNQLTGTLPEEAGNLSPFMALFFLSGNPLEGSIPTSLGKYTALNYLDLQHTHMTGPLPTELGLLTSLDALALRNSKFTGTLPSEISQLTMLRDFTLTDNIGISGTIPGEWSRLNGTLDGLAIAGTSLSGTIPSGVCQVPFLHWDCQPLCGCSPCDC